MKTRDCPVERGLEVLKTLKKTHFLKGTTGKEKCWGFR